MKLKWSMNIATVVAICGLCGADSIAQDATKEQIEAEQKIIMDAELQETLRAQKSAESLNKLAPEQIALRNLALERIKRMPPPPLPTNVPTASKTIRSYALKTESRPILSQGEKLRLRTDLMTSLYMDGMIGSQGSADLLNSSIAALGTELTDPQTIVESAYALATVIGTGEIQEQSLMMSARGVDYTSNPYVPINTPPFQNPLVPKNFGVGPWYTFNTGLDHPWTNIAREVVSSNGTAVLSYIYGFSENGNSRLRTSIEHHFDSTGRSVRHILAFWYAMVNVSTARIDFGGVQIEVNRNGSSTTNHVSQQLSNSSTWIRPAFIIPAVQNTNSTLSLVFAVNKGLNTTQSPLMALDPSVQWIPYWLQPIPEDLIVEKIDGEAWVQWNTIAYPTNSFKLTFAINAQGPWSDQIGVPVNYTNEVATAKFGTTNSARFYRLQNR